MEPSSHIFYPIPENYLWPAFRWNREMTSQRLILESDLLTVTVKDGSGFKTVVGDMVFTPGNKYFFQVEVLKGSLIKIGVTRKEIDLNIAFSDTTFGWAIYNGELRHNSNSSGKKYGSTYTNGDVVGVMLDMIKGTLGFSKNGKDWGIAFEDEALRTGELYAAVAPIYTNDSFKLRSPTPED